MTTRSKRERRRPRPDIPPSCGAKCLALVAGRLGVEATAAEIAAEADEQPEVASMASLIRAAKSRKLPAKPEQWSIEDLLEKGNEAAGRVLLHFPAGEGHFMVLESFDGSVCHATDPTTRAGSVAIPLARLERWWAGKVLVVGRSNPGSKKKPSKVKTLKKASSPSKTTRKRDKK